MGVCASGKTTLAQKLKSVGISCTHIAQEHSYVANMWQRITNPDILVFLQVSYSNTLKRRNLNWTESEYQEQIYRLRHAFQNANLIIDTDQLNPDQVFEQVLQYLKAKKLLLIEN